MWTYLCPSWEAGWQNPTRPRPLDPVRVRVPGLAEWAQECECPMCAPRIYGILSALLVLC